MARRTFRRDKGGGLRVALHTQEVELLAMTARDMSEIVESPPEGDVRDRLYPRAYLDPTEEAAERDFEEFVRDDLARARRAAFTAMATRLEQATPNKRGVVELTLDADEQQQWLTAVNDARLVVGTAIGVSEDDDGYYSPDDPRFEYGVLYAFLTGLHIDLVTLLLDEIGEAGEDGPG